MKLIKVRYETDNFHTIYSWLDENCRGAFYTGTDWDQWVVSKQNKMVEFEDEQDATLFALKWL